MTAPERPDPARLSIDSGWLVYDVGTHTCAGGAPESNGMHEPGCGLEPLMTVAELGEVLDALADTGAPINRPARAIAAAERRGAERALAPLRALFAGDPDTPCRTTWRDTSDGLFTSRVECVEVPLDELRGAFDEAEQVAAPPVPEAPALDEWAGL